MAARSRVVVMGTVYRKEQIRKTLRLVAKQLGELCHLLLRRETPGGEAGEAEGNKHICFKYVKCEVPIICQIGEEE